VKPGENPLCPLGTQPFPADQKPEDFAAEDHRRPRVVDARDKMKAPLPPHQPSMKYPSLSSAALRAGFRSPSRGGRIRATSVKTREDARRKDAIFDDPPTAAF